MSKSTLQWSLGTGTTKGGPCQREQVHPSGVDSTAKRFVLTKQTILDHLVISSESQGHHLTSCQWHNEFDRDDVTLILFRKLGINFRKKHAVYIYFHILLYVFMRVGIKHGNSKSFDSG